MASWRGVRHFKKLCTRFRNQLISMKSLWFLVISLISNIYNSHLLHFQLRFKPDFCILPRFRTNGFICQNFVTQMVIWSWSCITRLFIRAGHLSIGDYKHLLGVGTYNLQSISVLQLNKVWTLEIIVITFTQDFISYFKIWHLLTWERVACVQGTCSEDELVLLVCKNLLDFTENLPTMDWFLISAQARDFSFVKLISRFQVWFFSDFGQGVRDFTECWTPRPSRLPCQGTCWTL